MTAVSHRNPYHHIVRAYDLLHLGKLDLALEEAQQALALAPDLASAHVCIGWVLRQLRRLDAAQHAAQQALALAPSNSDAHLLLALLAWQQGRINQAERAFAEAYRCQNGDMPLLADTYARFLDARRQRKRAFALLNEVQRHYPQAARLHTRRGALLARADSAAAATAFREALRLDPRQTEAQIGMGRFHLAMRQPEAAQELFRTALQLTPDDEAARTGLAQALKAHNPLYRNALALVLLLQRRPMLQRRQRWLLALALFAPFAVVVAALVVQALFGNVPYFEVIFVLGSLYVMLLLLLVTLWGGLIAAWYVLIDPLFNALASRSRSYQQTFDLDSGTLLTTALNIPTIIGFVLVLVAAIAAAPDHIGVPLTALFMYFLGLRGLAAITLRKQLRFLRARRIGYAITALGGWLLWLGLTIDELGGRAYQVEALDSTLGGASGLFGALLLLVGLLLLGVVWALETAQRIEQHPRMQTPFWRWAMNPPAWQVAVLGIVSLGILLLIWFVAYR